MKVLGESGVTRVTAQAGHVSTCMRFVGGHVRQVMLWLFIASRASKAFKGTHAFVHVHPLLYTHSHTHTHTPVNNNNT